MRAHGTPPREPWAYGADAETIVRRNLELRYRLLPYILSEAVRCGHTSLPLCRAMALAFPADPTCATLDDQYMFGPDLLVAPILDARTTRMVYLPHGQWVDYTHHTLLEGGRWMPVSAALDVVPLFVRAGALIPHGPVQQYVDQLPLDPLTLAIYAPAAEGSYIIHDQGGREIVARYWLDGAEVRTEVIGASGEVRVEVYGQG